MERLYFLISLRGNRKTYLTTKPFTHKECMTMKSKFNSDSQAYITVEEVVL